jgi:hypothetical protein
MATIIRKAAYFSMHTAHRAGVGARMLKGLRDAGVNLRAFSGFPHAGRAQVDFIPYDAGQFLRAVHKLGLKVGKRKTVFIAQGDDKPGVVAAICDKLAKARINMVAMDAVAAGKGRCGAIFWVKPKDIGRASRVLGAR